MCVATNYRLYRAPSSLVHLQQYCYSSSSFALITRKLCYSKDDRAMRAISRSSAAVEIWPFEIIQDGGGRHLEFVRIENSAIRSAVPENPTYNQT